MYDTLIQIALFVSLILLIFCAYTFSRYHKHEMEIERYIERNECTRTGSLKQTRTKLVFVDKKPIYVAGRVKFAYICNDSTVIWR